MNRAYAETAERAFEPRVRNFGPDLIFWYFGSTRTRGLRRHRVEPRCVRADREDDAPAFRGALRRSPRVVLEGLAPRYRPWTHPPVIQVLGGRERSGSPFDINSTEPLSDRVAFKINVMGFAPPHPSYDSCRPETKW